MKPLRIECPQCHSVKFKSAFPRNMVMEGERWTGVYDLSQCKSCRLLNGKPTDEEVEKRRSIARTKGALAAKAGLSMRVEVEGKFYTFAELEKLPGAPSKAAIRSRYNDGRRGLDLIAPRERLERSKGIGEVAMPPMWRQFICGRPSL